jgi:hypothetical protein
MQLCFVSVHGPRKTYFVDEPRICCSGRGNSLENGHIHKEGDDLYETQFMKNVMCINLAEYCAKKGEVLGE